MNNRQQGKVSLYLAMLLATLAVTLGVALALYAPAERTPSFVLSMVMLCFAETTLFAFPIYHARAGADIKAPAFAFGFGFQAALVIYALGVVLLGLLSGAELHDTRWFVSFRNLAIAHVVWLLALALTAGFWRIGSNHASRGAAAVQDQRHDFLQLRARVGSFAANVALDREPTLKAFVSAVQALHDDVTHATPESLPGTESFNTALLSALERLGAEHGRVRAQIASAAAPGADIHGLVDKVRAMAVMVRERDAAIRAAR